MNKLNNKLKENFTLIPNGLIRNKNISDRARFLFCYMASMPDDWKFYQSVMAKELGYSVDTLRKYLEELLTTGYLEREQRRQEGKFDSYDYTINFLPYGENTDTEKTRHGKIPSRKKSALTNKDLEQIKNNTNKDFNKDIINEKVNFSLSQEEENKNFSETKINPFTIVSNLQSEKEKEKNCSKKEKESQAERKPNPTYEAFTVFCQTFEQLSGAKYPTDKNGYYIMSPKDAGGMVYLLRWLEKVDRSGNTIEALKVFLNAAWTLNDKWIKANFTPATLYGQSAKIFTAYQTSSPEAKKKAYDDEVDRLLAEKMKKYQNQ